MASDRMDTLGRHLSAEDWSRLSRGEGDPQWRAMSDSHIATCDFCAGIRDFVICLEQGTRRLMMNPVIFSAARKRYLAAFAGLRLNLHPLERKVRREYLLAADGAKRSSEGKAGIATYVCEDPPVTLRLARNGGNGQLFLQVVAENLALYSRVLLQSFSAGILVVTDEEGQAMIDLPEGIEVGDLEWLVTLPLAEYELPSLRDLNLPAEIVLGSDAPNERNLIRIEANQRGESIRIRATGYPEKAADQIVAVSQAGGVSVLGTGGELEFAMPTGQSGIHGTIQLYRV